MVRRAIRTPVKLTPLTTKHQPTPTVGELFMARVPGPAGLLIAYPALIAGMGFLALSLAASSFILLVIGGVIAGFGQGLGFRAGLAGVVALGPRVVIRLPGDSDLTDAYAMVKSGTGDQHGNFNNGRLYATANVLLSFEGPASVFADPQSLVSKVSVPLLWVAANDDLGPRDPTALFNYAKPNPLNALVWSKSDEFSMVDVSIDEVLAWLAKLKAAAK